MTYLQFQELPKKAQTVLIDSKGKFLSKRETATYEILLYEVYNFCVQVYRDKNMGTVASCNSIYFN